MAQARKLQEEITRTIKKVNEGLAQFDDIWEKVYSAQSQTQKEKFEGDLKKEIKKLQRLRDVIKTWISGNDSIKDKKPLMEARKSIETKMEKFKECEKQAKQKKYSNNALSAGGNERKTPEEIAKDNTRGWINDALDGMGMQLEAFEAELEAQQTSLKKGKTSKRGGGGSWQELMVEKHAKHRKLLEFLLREMENEHLEPSDIDELKDSIEQYVEDSGEAEAEVEFDEYLYDSVIDDVEAVCAADDFGSNPNDEEEELVDESGVISPATGPLKPKKKKEEKKKDAPKSPEPSSAKRPSRTTTPTSTPPLQPQAAPTAPKKPSVAAVVAGTATTTTVKKDVKKEDKVDSKSKDKKSRGGSSIGTATPPEHKSDSEADTPVLRKFDRSSKQQSGETTPTSSKTKEDDTFAPLARDKGATTPTSGPLLPQAAPSLSSLDMADVSAAALAMGALEGDDDDDDFLNDETFGVEDVGVGSLAELSAQTAKLQFERPPRTATPSTTASSTPVTSVPSSPTSSAQSAPHSNTIHPPLSPSTPSSQLQPPPSAAVTEAQQQQVQQQRQALQMLEASLPFLPSPTDCERLKPYMPPNPYRTPDYYPKTPHPAFNNPDIFEKFDTDTLFFIFYYQQATYQQYLAAHELKKQSWRYHKKYLTWFQRHDQPKVATDEYEQGTYVYFDYETGWCQRIKQEFLFKYLYLENELPV